MLPFTYESVLDLYFSASVHQEKKNAYVKMSLSKYLFRDTRTTEPVYWETPLSVLAALLLSDIVYKEGGAEAASQRSFFSMKSCKYWKAMGYLCGHKKHYGGHKEHYGGYSLDSWDYFSVYFLMC